MKPGSKPKTTERLAACCLALALCPAWLSACGAGREAADPVPGFCEPNQAPFPKRPQPKLEPSLPALRVEGSQLLDDHGQPVALRGMNFGSWLMMESWIAGIGTLSEDALLDELERRAADLGLGELLTEAQDQNRLDWLTETKSHWVCIQEWRQHCLDQASADQHQAVGELWAWFDEQPWVYEEQGLWRHLTARFGAGGAGQLRAAFADHYITGIDVERLSALGLNLIRVPVWYEALETDWVGENHFREDGWRRLDELAHWARQHGVYLMIDLHGAPGGQSTSWHQGLMDGGHLWSDERCIQKTERLWQALASYFSGDPHVAVYDLLNEPMSAPDRQTFAAVHDRLYRAVRLEDDETIVMIEDGYRAASQLVGPAELGWEQAMYSIHLYPGGSSAQDYLERMEEEILGLGPTLDSFGVPIFLGEFNAADGTDSEGWAPEAMDQVLAMLNRRGIHWAPWTWKYCDPDSIWGLYRPAAGEVRIDVKEASREAILADFQALDSQNYQPEQRYAQALRDRSADAVAPLDLER